MFPGFWNPGNPTWGERTHELRTRQEIETNIRMKETLPNVLHTRRNLRNLTPTLPKRTPNLLTLWAGLFKGWLLLTRS